MNTKLSFLTLILTLAVNFCTAQVSVSKSGFGKLKELKKEDFQAIKTKKTVFVVDDLEVNQFKAIADNVWKVNQFEVVDREEFEKNKEAKYINDTYAICEMSGFIRTTRTSSGMEVEYLYVYLHYFYPTDIKVKKNKVKYDTNTVATVFFGGNTEAMWKMIGNAEFGNLTEDLYNYKPGYLKNYLQYINDHLVAGKNSWVYETEYDKTKIKALKKAILYIPEYMKIKSNWGWSDSERENPDELFKDYGYKYEYISDEDLNSKILNGSDEDFYYLMYTRVNGQKLITVINGKDGDIVYKDYQTMSYQIKPKDLKELKKAISK